MKNPFRLTLKKLTGVLLLAAAVTGQLQATPAPVLFNEEFNSISGWSVVKPAYGGWSAAASGWGYDQQNDAIYEISNIYSDSTASSASRMAVMFINDTVPPTSGYEYKVRLTMVDNDGCGLIFGYQNEQNYYRLQFANESSVTRLANFPFTGWNFDRMANNTPTDFAGQSFGTNNFVPTLNQPFEVSISVTNDHVWIRVFDNPDAFPPPIDLVLDWPLPTTPSGKVGLFSWGMQATAPAPGFAAQNRSLSPTPLAAITNVWENLITPNATGTTFGATPPAWGETLDGLGNGFLRMNAPTADENVAATRVNVRTAAYVAGSTTWSNYVMHSRVSLYDDDGWGIYVRYVDSTNFIRLAFRSQTGTVTTGVKVGTSVQKATNMVFSELALFAGTANAPAANGAGPTTAPGPVQDLFAVVQTNTLMLHLVTTLDGVSTTVTRGPIAMNNHANGKIGIWGWFQSYNDWDFVKVYAVSNTPLYVTSEYGPVEPPTGMNDLPLASTVNAYAANVFDAPGQRRVATGWRRTFENGNVVSGSGSNVSFTLNQISTLRWDWKGQFELLVTATSGGTVNFVGSQYLDGGTVTNLVATPNAGFIFVGWSGLPSASLSTNLTLTVTRPHTVAANFAADSDADGLADQWEITYFGNLAQAAGGDPDSDGKSNLFEFQLGTNPNAVEPLVAIDGLNSRWVNEGRDRSLPGWLVVTNLGNGFRGLFDDSNDGIGANVPGVSGAGFIDSLSYTQNVSFQSPLFVVRSNVWDNSWLTNFSLQVEYSVGDNDGSCIYVRYLNEYNYYRVTLDGQATGGSLVNPVQGISIQKRVNGLWAAIPQVDTGTQPGLFPDPVDAAGFTKRLKITVGATNSNFEVRAIGWNTNLNLGLGDWDPNFERIVTFSDSDLSSGRIGFAGWAQGGFGFPTSTGSNPIDRGWYADNITVTNSGVLVFSEDWETAAQSTDFPPGWTNPFSTTAGLVGDWRVSAHGTIGQISSTYGSLQTGSTGSPKTDGEGPTLLAPALTNLNYVLELNITPWDDGGIGFVYDFVDTNNYARVLFDSQVPLAGQLPQGLNVSRKTAGVWSDIVIGDTSFVYTPGRSFDIRFVNNNGLYKVAAWNTDAPGTINQWQWTGPATTTTNYGLAAWNMPDGHFNRVRAYSLAPANPLPPVASLSITNITLQGGNVILGISKAAGASYHVLRATDVLGPYITNAANQNTFQYSEPAPVGNSYFYRLQLLQ